LGFEVVRSGVGPIGVDAVDRDQWKAEVADALEEAVESRLVQGDTAKEREAAGLVREARDPERCSPAGIEMSPDADLVSSALVASG
jgi:hypothetical protein